LHDTRSTANVEGQGVKCQGHSMTEVLKLT